MCQCPAHDDRNASLSIKATNDRILLHCFAGCEPEAVVEALGLRLTDLYYDELSGTSGPLPAMADRNLSAKKEAIKEYAEEEVLARSSAHYDYITEAGDHAYRVVRHDTPDGKTFAVWHKLMGDVWATGLGGSPHVLYRLGELTTTSEGDTVFVVEGEKCVERMHDLGFVATTNSFGAGKWQTQYSRHFLGRHVVVFPDNDDAGRKHADQVASSLRPVAASVRIVTIPGLHEKGDIADFIDGGADRAAIERLLEEQEERTAIVLPDGISGVTAQELMTRHFAEPVWVVPGLLPSGLSILAGKPKVGKSWLCLQLALDTAFGGRTLGSFNLAKGRAVYLALEDSDRRLQQRLGKQLEGRVAPQDLILVSSWKQLDKGGLEDLERLLSRVGPNVVFIDTLGKVTPTATRGGYSYDLDYERLRGLHELAKVTGVGIVIVHHLRKSGSDDPLDLVSGTTGLTGSADTILVLRRGRPSKSAELFVTGRDVEEQNLSLQFDPERGVWIYEGTGPCASMSPERREIAALFTDKEQVLSTSDIIARSGKVEGTVKAILSKMASDQQLQRTQKGVYRLLCPSA